MFNCARCGGTTKPHEKLTRVVTEKRPKVYKDRHGSEIGRGWEIAKEIAVCPKCAADGQAET